MRVLLALLLPPLVLPPVRWRHPRVRRWFRLARNMAGRPTAAYRATLADAMSGHGGPANSATRLEHFVEAQLVWDRAMAEAIAAQRPRQVVAIMEAGHLEYRDGAPHPLAALGVDRVAVLLPEHDVCAPVPTGFADAVFID